jgi:hypothetical protein
VSPIDGRRAHITALDDEVGAEELADYVADRRELQ